ncbi:TonB-dependent receptor [Sphingomonas sp. R1]|uniref:TonB-dependent receptor n=1 Tax=Sphingomonas sp. R1 TaxID=399176 RepID=UPI0022252E9E|nr:TonB-dependent receptor [Sphingomonas sp. R1]UYY78488.1 TonB-dependent receptor [Sphingomonas sp. R1]
MKSKFLALTAVSMAAIATPALAQEQAAAESATAAPQDDTQPNDIIVTGYRQSLRTSLAAKRNADRVVEELAAEDLGKLPEASIAESLARLPGLATNRDRGNGTQISIRGMGPNLVNTLLNGREIASAEGSRNIRYEQFPAELLTGASVYKTPTGSQVEGGLAGQVDLKTVRPLDYKETKIALNARAIYSDLAKDVTDTSPWGYIASASVVTQLLDDTLGLAVGYSGRRQSVATVRTNIFRYQNSFADLDGNGSGAPGHGGAAQDDIPYGYEALERGGDDIRHGAVAAVQWRPSDRLELNGDFLYSHVSFEETQRGFRVGSLAFGNNITGVTTRNGYVTGATITGVQDYGQTINGVNENFFFKDDLYAGGMNAVWRPADGWKLSGDVGYSTTTRNQQYLTLQTDPFNFRPSATFRSGNDSVPVMSFNTSLTDPSLFRVARFQIPNGGAARIKDDLLTLTGDIQREIGAGPLAAIRFGVRHTERTKTYKAMSQFGDIAAANRTVLDPSLINGTYRFKGEFAGLPAIQSIDIYRTVERLFGRINPQESIFDSTSSWRVEEKTSALYGQVDLDGALFGVPFTGNVGLRVVRTETDSRSTALSQNASATVVTPIRVRNDFYDWLPSLNLTFKPTSKLQIRFAASEAIARPPLDDLNAGSGLFDFGTPNASGGNPLLEPFRAKQLDATVEWYFDRDSALTISGFYKDLGTYITRQVTERTLPDANGIPRTVAFTQPVNGNGGTIKGVEVGLQKAFTFLPAPFDGFGVNLNYSYTDSDITVTEADNALGATPLPGLSKHVGNASLYFNKWGFEARIAGRYRSAYVTELGDTDRILFNAPETVLDFYTSYEFPWDSKLRGVKLMFQANNLTDEPFETYYGDRALQGRFEKFGRRFLMGVGYTF